MAYNYRKTNTLKATYVMFRPPYEDGIAAKGTIYLETLDTVGLKGQDIVIDDSH